MAVIREEDKMGVVRLKEELGSLLMIGKLLN